MRPIRERCHALSQSTKWTGEYKRQLFCDYKLKKITLPQAILYKMREKAFQVYSQFRSGNGIPNKTLSVGKPDYGDDELALFGGQTRVLVSKLLSCSSNKSRKPSQSQSTSSTTVSSPSSDGDSRSTPSSDVTRDVHPSLVEYLSMFPPPSTGGSLQGSTDIAGSNLPASSPIQAEAEQQPNWQNWSSPSTSSLFTPLNPETFANITNEFPSFSNSMFTEEPVQLKTDPSDTSLVDLGMMMTGESGMDEQWMSFMRDSGFLQLDGGNTINNMSYNTPNLQFNPQAGGTPQGY